MFLQAEATSDDYSNTSPKKELEVGRDTVLLRKSKEASYSDIDKKARYSVSEKSKELFFSHIDNEVDALRKYKETTKIIGSYYRPKSNVSSCKNVLDPMKPPESGNVLVEADRLSPKSQDLPLQRAIADGNSGAISTKKVTLCSDCRAASKKAICYIANDGRVAASSRPSGHIPCKYHWCAGHDPDYVSSFTTQPKKFLVSKRHAMNAQIASKSKSRKTPSPSSDKKGSQFSSSGDEVSSHDKTCSNDAYEFSSDKKGSQSSGDEVSSHDKTTYESSSDTKGSQFSSFGDEVSLHDKICSNDAYEISSDKKGSQFSGSGDEVSSHDKTCSNDAYETSSDKKGSQFSGSGDEVSSHDRTCSNDAYEFSSDKKGSQFLSSGDEVSSHDKACSSDACQSIYKSGSGSELLKTETDTCNPVESSGCQVYKGTYGCSSKRCIKGCTGTVQKQESEEVKLRKQLIQERKQAGEWMMNCKIEDAVQKLSPSGEHRVKILVEAFESIMSNNDSEMQEQH